MIVSRKLAGAAFWSSLAFLGAALWLAGHYRDLRLLILFPAAYIVSYLIHERRGSPR